MSFKKPSTVVMMMGTNDGKKPNWNEGSFKSDFKKLVGDLKNYYTKVIVCTPPPLMEKDFYTYNQDVINKKLPKIIEDIGNQAGVEVIDTFSAMGGESMGKPSAFKDSVHPSEEGNKIIAKAVADKLDKEA